MAITTPYCWFIRRRLGAYRDAELSASDRRRIEAHLQSCEPCSRELRILDSFRTALTSVVAAPPEAVWTAFWPQVRDRIAAPVTAPEPTRPWLWTPEMARPRLGMAPALAAGALAVLAVVAPWAPRHESPAPTAVAGRQEPATVQTASLDQVVIQSIETEDPDVPVMVYASPESDVTVLWVFGLERTGA